MFLPQEASVYNFCLLKHHQTNRAMEIFIPGFNEEVASLTYEDTFKPKWSYEVFLAKVVIGIDLLKKKQYNLVEQAWGYHELAELESIRAALEYNQNLMLSHLRSN